MVSELTLLTLRCGSRKRIPSLSAHFEQPPGSKEAIAVSWVLPFGGTWCLLHLDLRPLDGHRGIWFLRQRDRTLKVFGGTNGWYYAPLETRYIGAVRNAIQQEWHTGGTR